MAHRSPAQKAAFRRMIAARKASIAGKPRRRRRRRNNPSAALANPRRRRRRRSLARRRRNPSTSLTRMNPMSRRARRRRRNPGGAIMESVKLLFKAGVPGVIGGGVFGVIDAKLLADASPIVRVGSKVGVAWLAGLLLRRHPIAAASAIGGIIGSASYSGAMSMAGGVSAPSTVAAVKGMGVLLRTDKRALGILIEQMKGIGLTVMNATPKLGAGAGPRLAPLPGGQVVGSVNLG